MRVPVTWLREHVELPAGLTGREVAAGLVRVGLEVETVEPVGADLTGPLMVGQVRDFDEFTASNGKTIRWCSVDVGEDQPRGIVCGARNFVVGDTVVIALPGAVLPGGFRISARATYGHVSDGMICSARELGLGEDDTGILVLPPDATVGADAIGYLELRDDVLDIAVSPDRGYALSVRGLAREASHAFDAAFRDPADSVRLPPPDGAGWPVRIDDVTGCDRFSARTVTGLDPAAPAPLVVRRRLLLCGMRPISLAVDVTNYVMLETGQPMHAFDRARLTGALVVRRARAGERLTTLDGVRRELDPDDLLVTDESGPIALAGVMGGASTEIGPGSTDTVLEAAHWDPASISRSARRHRLPSEASRRFERGVDPEVAGPALQRAAELLAQFGGASAGTGFTVAGPGPERATITLAAAAPERVAGMPIPGSAVVRRLEQVGCAVGGSTGDPLGVIPPSWRPDLTDPADLVEEVVRLEGYDRIPSVLPAPPPGRGLTGAQRTRRSVGRALAEAGYIEVQSYPFIGPEIHDAFGLAADDPRRQALRLVNPLSEAEPELRTSLLPGLLATLRRNLGRGLRDVALFEVGPVYLPRAGRVGDLTTAAARGDAGASGEVAGWAGAPDGLRGAGASGALGAPRLPVDRRPTDAELAQLDAALPDQPRRVAVVLSGERAPNGWWGTGRDAEWADAVQAARVVAATVGVDVAVSAGAHPPWHPGRCARLHLGSAAGPVIGYAGELHPRVLAALELPPRVCAAEFDLDALGMRPLVAAPTLSAFPPALLDVALVAPATVPAGEVEAALRDGAGELLESLRLFDVYADADRLGAGRRSLAYAMRFRATDRTLTVEEATAARDAAVAEAGRRTGAALRT